MSVIHRFMCKYGYLLSSQVSQEKLSCDRKCCWITASAFTQSDTLSHTKHTEGQFYYNLHSKQMGGNNTTRFSQHVACAYKCKVNVIGHIVNSRIDRGTSSKF